jgi:Arm DNA-binding domain
MNTNLSTYQQKAYAMLTDSQIKKLKNPPVSQKAPDKHSDGGGLQLHLFGHGGKYWRMAYRFNGKQKTFSVGTYPDVTLAEARRKRDDAKNYSLKELTPVKPRNKRLKKIQAKTVSSILRWSGWNDKLINQNQHFVKIQGY